MDDHFLVCMAWEGEVKWRSKIVEAENIILEEDVPMWTMYQITISDNPMALIPVW